MTKIKKNQMAEMLLEKVAMISLMLSAMGVCIMFFYTGNNKDILTAVVVAETVIFILSYIFAEIASYFKLKKTKGLLTEIVLCKMKENQVSGTVKVGHFEQTETLNVNVTLYCDRDNLKKIYSDVMEEFKSCEKELSDVFKQKFQVQYNEVAF